MMIPLFKRKKLSTHARINVEANMISGKSRRELLELQVREQDLKQKIGFLKEELLHTQQAIQDHRGGIL